MERRTFMMALSCLFGSTASDVAAQQRAAKPTIAVLVNKPDSTPTVALLNALKAKGYVDGRTARIGLRSFGADYARLPVAASELIALKPDILAIIGAVECKAVLKVTTTIPIVFAIVPDATAAGLVPDDKHPGGNITGFTLWDPQGPRRQQELLKKLLPNLKRLAILGDGSVPPALFVVNEETARSLDIEPMSLKLQAGVLDVAGAFDMGMKQNADAFLILYHPATDIHRREISDLVSARRMPSMWPVGFVEPGWSGLIAYGTSLDDAATQMPDYVDKILNGANPGDLPVLAVTRKRLILNADFARKIGAALPSDLLRQADLVVSGAS